MGSLLTLRPDQLVKCDRFALLEETDPRYKVTVFEEPRPVCAYGAGLDTALGIVGRDLDCLQILNRETWPLRQVCEITGTLGEDCHKVVYAAMKLYYGNVFLVAERAAMGLMTLRALRDMYGYGWLYFEHKLDRATQLQTKQIGYAKNLGTSDPAIVALRSAICQNELEFLSEECINQLSRCQFKARDTIEADEAVDGDMKIKLAGGGSPDIMQALAYANWAVREIGNFPKPKPRYERGTLGDVLGHEEIAVRPAHKEVDRPDPSPLTARKPRVVLDLRKKG